MRFECGSCGLVCGMEENVWGWENGGSGLILRLTRQTTLRETSECWRDADPVGESGDQSADEAAGGSEGGSWEGREGKGP